MNRPFTTKGEDLNYSDFIATKRRDNSPAGFEAEPTQGGLFPHQDAIVNWSCRMGRSAVFADTGLGKTRIQLEWARQVVAHTGGKVLILAPLAVNQQTLSEATRMGMGAGPVGSDPSVHVINYDRLHQVDVDDYVGVVLDESSILKSYDGKTRTALIRAFSETPYRMACTATPAPNDHSELGNHAEFLGICSRLEMLAEFFCHDGGNTNVWRLKGHAVRDFWRWVATWAVLVRKPIDLGFDDDRYELPPLRFDTHTIRLNHSDAHAAGLLFIPTALTLNDQRRMRRATMTQRVEQAALLANGNSHPWLVWCELNAESDAIAKAIPDAVEVRGADKPEIKADRLLGFAEGRYRVLVTKPSIAGFGMNWQHCSRVVFAGLTHSYEQFYQAVRRCWRFGQDQPVTVHFIQSEADQAIAQNLARKSASADELADEMLALVRDTQLASVRGIRPGTVDPADGRITIPSWLKTEITA